jgi:hypothetical protein
MKFMKKYAKVYAGFEILVVAVVRTGLWYLPSDTASFPEKCSPQQEGRFSIECHKPLIGSQSHIGTDKLAFCQSTLRRIHGIW